MAAVSLGVVMERECKRVGDHAASRETSPKPPTAIAALRSAGHHLWGHLAARSEQFAHPVTVIDPVIVGWIVQKKAYSPASSNENVNEPPPLAIERESNTASIDVQV